MATKKKTIKEAKVVDAKKEVSNKIILGPRITEKAAALSEKSVYTLNVSRNATKSEIAKAVKAIHGVTPIRIAISITPRQKVFVRGKRGVKGGGKKAMVTLKKGDKMAFM